MVRTIPTNNGFLLVDKLSGQFQLIDRLSPESMIPTIPTNSRPPVIIVVRILSINRLTPKPIVPTTPTNRKSPRSIGPTIPIYTQSPNQLSGQSQILAETFKLFVPAIIIIIPINK